MAVNDYAVIQKGRVIVDVHREQCSLLQEASRYPRLGSVQFGRMKWQV
jgi:hypothetical protein